MEVITLNQENFRQKCEVLISKIETTPDLIIGIVNGGGYVLKEFKKYERFKGTTVKSVRYQRKNGIKNFYLTKVMLKILPYAILNGLRIKESKKVKSSIANLNLEELKNISINTKSITAIPVPNKILIVDDAIDSGKTMWVTKNNLYKLFPQAEIKIAVISWTIAESIIKPDYYLFKNTLVRFPWSKDYKGKDFEK